MAVSLLSSLGLDFLTEPPATGFTVSFSVWHRGFLLECMGAASRPTFGLLWEVE